MKMHPAPKVRHNYPVITCVAVVSYEEFNPLPVHIILSIDGKTQRIVMSRDEALAMSKDLAESAQAS